MCGTFKMHGEMINLHHILVRKPEDRDREVDGRVILNWTEKKKGVRMWTGFNWLELAFSIAIL
jgi:hypothetical protein